MSRLPFHEVKSRAIVYCIKLEKTGKISRADNYQGLLVSIASDIRQKHHLRKMGKQNLMAMTRAYEDLSQKKATFDEQVTSYHDYIDSSMASLQQKGYVYFDVFGGIIADCLARRNQCFCRNSIGIKGL
jgi:Ras GTPase-activating-like protein IQGAP2/3